MKLSELLSIVYRAPDGPYRIDFDVDTLGFYQVAAGKDRLVAKMLEKEEAEFLVAMRLVASPMMKLLNATMLRAHAGISHTSMCPIGPGSTACNCGVLAIKEAMRELGELELP